MRRQDAPAGAPRRLPVLLLAAAISIGAGAAWAADAERKLPRVDEGLQDPAWPDFKARLLKSLAVRDRGTLLGIVDGAVDNGSSYRRGLAEFRRAWKLDAGDDPKESPVYTELSKILFLGSAWREGPGRERWLCAPYAYARWPAEVDRFTNGAILGDDVLVKESASHESKTIARLSHDVVPVEDWDVEDAAKLVKQSWVKIRVGGQTGYVPEEQIRSAVEHRACFAKRGGAWRIVMLGAGE